MVALITKHSNNWTLDCINTDTEIDNHLYQLPTERYAAIHRVTDVVTFDLIIQEYL